MKNIQKSARTLDILFNILQVLVTIALVSCLVGVAIISIGIIFQLPENLMGTDFTTIEIQSFSFSVNEKNAPSINTILLFTAVILALAAIMSFFARLFIQTIRKVLHPVIAGLPFDITVANNLKKAALLILVMGIGLNIVTVVQYLFATNVFQLPVILLSDKITAVNVTCNIDLSFLITAIIIYLISCVCRYGATLQQQVDETL